MAKKKRKASEKPRARRAASTRSQRVNLLKSDALVQSAQQAWLRHQHEHAISLYEQALRRDPTSRELLIDLARAYGLRYRLEEAETLLQRVLRLAPRSAKTRGMVARSYAMIQRHAQAMEHYERAVELGAGHRDLPTFLVELARLYEREHRLTDAREAVERALSLGPDREDALLARAGLLIRQAEVESGRDGLRQLVESENVSPQVRSDAWYEIGKLHDREGDYDAAMRAFKAAKVLLRPQVERFERERRFLQKRDRLMLEQLTPELLRRWHDAEPAEQRRPFALLTGHPRSGTTLIEQVLDGHSQLMSADEYLTMGELVFRPLAMQYPDLTPTPDGLDRTSSEMLAGLRGQYWQKTEALLGQPVGRRLLLDKNPGLAYLLPVICRVFPEMKLLFALRDPRDVVISCFMQRLPINSIALNYLSVEATAVKYADVMHFWLTIRPMLCCPWQEIRYEDTVDDLPRQAARALEFLDLPWEENIVDFHTHAQSKLVRSPTYEAVTQPLYRHAIGRWHNYAKHLEPVLETLQPYLKAFGYE